MEIISTVITPASVPAIDVSWARKHLKSIADEEDDLIESWIGAAASSFSEYTSRPIMIETREAWLDAFPVERKIELPNPPLVEVESVQYIAADGTLTDFSDGSPTTALWQSRTPQGLYARRGWIEPLDGQVWPTARNEAGAVRIQYRAGYASDTSEVPDIIKNILLRMVGSFDRFRTDIYISEGARLESLPLIDEMVKPFKNHALASQVLHRP